MICRGFSLRILTDIYKYKNINNNNIIYKYADNKGIDWLFTKRLDSIKKIKLIYFKEDTLFLTKFRGNSVAYLTFLLKKILLIKNSGE